MSEALPGIGATRTLQTDVLVVGSGGAGCRAAITARNEGVDVTLITSARLGVNASTFYPGNISLGMAAGATEAEIEQHYQDILAAAMGMCDKQLARILVQEAPLRLSELFEWGLPFVGAEGERIQIRPDFGRPLRIRRARLPDMRDAFRRLIRERGVRVLEHTHLVDLLADENGTCVGAVCLGADGQLLDVRAGATVLATGGPNNVFLYHVNTPGLTGDGHALALKLGAELVNMEFYQIIFKMVAPFRGLNFAGNYICQIPHFTNALGEDFLPNYLPPEISVEECVLARAKHSPFSSDAVGRYFDIALISEVNAGRGTPNGGIWCDFRGVDRVALRQERPDYFDWMMERGLDMASTPVEIMPAPHAFNGGVLINTECESAVPNLFACGEVMGGPHGANRVGGNRFADTQVFGARAGKYAAARALQWRDRTKVVSPSYHYVATPEASRADGPSPKEVQKAAQRAMWEEMVVEKDTSSLKRLLSRLEEIEADLLPRVKPRSQQELGLAYSLPHQLRISEAIAQAALMRAESRGPHYRIDYPKRNDSDFGRPIIIAAEGSTLHLEMRALGGSTTDLET